MSILKKFLDAVNYRISGGSEYCWSCFGENAYCLDSDITDSISTSIIFDTDTHEVCEVDIIDSTHLLAFRWINDAYKEEYISEAGRRGVDPYPAFDGCKFTDVTLQEIFRLISSAAEEQSFDVDDFSGNSDTNDKGNTQMVDRFTLENEIMRCWGVVEDIDTVYSTLGSRHMSADELQNSLLGLKTLYQLKFEHLFSVFEDLIRQKKL